LGVTVFFILSLTSKDQLYSQDIEKEIIVVNPYEPSLPDAQKISLLPSISDTAEIQENINYKLLPTRVSTSFDPKTINPARMVGLPVSKLYNSLLELGIGNYFTPYGRLNISSLRNKKYAVGAEFMHKSSHTKLKLDNDDKVNAGYGINKIDLYGKRIFRNSTLSGNLGIRNHRLNYYGYNTTIFSDSLPDIDSPKNRQNFIVMNAVSKIASNHVDSAHFNYLLDINYNYIRDKFENSEHELFLNGDFSGMAGSFMLGLDAGLGHLSPSQSMDSSKTTIIKANPGISKQGPEWNFSLGVNTYTEKYIDTDLHIYPHAELQISIIKDVLLPFFGITGFLESNYYAKTASENSFIAPGTSIKSTDHKFIGYAGIKGQFVNQSGFRADITYSQINDMYFFVNDTSGILQNRFAVTYDDVELVQYHGEVYFDAGDRLNFLLSGNYYDYATLNAQKAWHKPQFDLTFKTTYNLRDKILFDLSFLGYGKRYAKKFDNGNEPVEMKGFLDANLKIEYRYSKLLSAFLNVCNISASGYELWNQYPAQRLNLMVGFTYKL